MTSQPEKQAVTMYILVNITSSKGNETIKFGQLIEYNMSNICLKNSYQKCGEENISRPFSKKIKIG